MSQTIGEIVINDREKWFIDLNKTQIVIRVYRRDDKSGNWVCTNRLIGIDTKTWPEFKKLIDQALPKVAVKGKPKPRRGIRV